MSMIVCSKNNILHKCRLYNVFALTLIIVLLTFTSYAYDDDVNVTKKELDLHFGAYVIGGAVKSSNEFKKFDNRSNKDNSLAFSAELGIDNKVNDKFDIAPYLDATLLGEYKNSVTTQIGLGVMPKYKIDDNYSLIGSLEVHKAVLNVLSDYNSNKDNKTSKDSSNNKNKNNVIVRYRGNGLMLGLGIEHENIAVKLIYNKNYYSNVYKIEYNTNDINDKAKKDIKAKAPTKFHVEFIGLAFGVDF